MDPRSPEPGRAGASSAVLLFELPGIRWSAERAQQARRSNPGLVLDIMTAVADDETWIYVPARKSPDGEPSHDPDALLGTFLGTEARATPRARARRLTGLHTIGDAAEGNRQRWHYTSQMDVPPGAEEEFNDWFDQEHLPRLAAVPGTVHAARYRTDGSPRYLAGYDLEEQDVRGGRAWRAALVSPWRDRIHGQFIGSRRLMFMRLR